MRCHGFHGFLCLQTAVCSVRYFRDRTAYLTKAADSCFMSSFEISAIDLGRCHSGKAGKTSDVGKVQNTVSADERTITPEPAAVDTGTGDFFLFSDCVYCGFYLSGSG